MIKQLMRVLISVAAVAIAVPVSGQEFPSRPVKIVVPQTPGGASDALARIVGQKLSEKWQQPVVVENRPGAGGNLGMEFVAQAPADGYTLLMSYVGSHAINAALYKKLPFDPERDFAPVATLATLPFVLVARPDAPFKTVRELADLGKRQPLTFGSAGNGSVNHLLGVMFNAAAGSKLEHIPYRGAAPAMQDLMSGQISLVFTSLPSVASAIRSGSLRGIAVTSAQRSQAFAQIPTIAESGYKDFDVSPWFGLFAPAKTPPAIVRRMNQDIQEILKNREVIEKFQGQGADPFITQPAEFAAILKSDLAKWSEVVKASGAQID
ncbi:MAG: Bug family tripartite tricarboxylate transporter substrate binding protein [Limnohabitans sp.]|jgi:tripartite-type tricarboxylate transporter receptor subunit TctC|nr:tripartite tricarboxylate transporter substrate binding protein [Burkholderiaceae bacterium]